MIHLRKISRTCSKSVLKSYKPPLLRSKPLRGLLKPECTSSATQIIRFLSVEEKSIQLNTKDDRDEQDETNKEVSNMLTKFSERIGENTNRNVDRFEEKMTIEEFQKYIKEVDASKSKDAVRVIHRFCGFFSSRLFPIMGLSRFKNVEQIIPPSDFEKVFETIEQNLRYLNYHSLLKTLDACTILKISDKSSLMQKLIRLLSLNINSMSSLDVVHIFCIIEKYYSTDNKEIDALKTACFKFFQYYFENHINPNSQPDKLAQYAFFETLPLNVKECFIKKVIDYKGTMSLWSYAGILKALSMPGVFEYSNFQKQSVSHVIREVIKHKESDYSFNQLLYFLQNYKLGVLRRRIPYNEKLLDTIASKIVKSNPPLSGAMAACRFLFQLSHFNYDCFDYFTSKVENELNSGELNLNHIDLVNLTKILSVAGKNTKINNIHFREKLKTACLFLPKLENVLNVQLTFNLAVLGIYEDRLIEHCFTSENGGVLTEEDIKGFNDFTRNSLLLLHQAVTAFHPSYEGPLLSEELVTKLTKIPFVVSEKHKIWQEVVESYFGGPNFVMKNCTTPLYHNLSYVVVLDKNNVPVDVSSIQGTQSSDQPFNIADITMTEEKQVIVIQDIWTEGQLVFRNTPCWKGNFQLYLDVLEVYCSGVIPLLISEFMSLQDSERVPYLLSKIEKKFGVLSKPMSTES